MCNKENFSNIGATAASMMAHTKVIIDSSLSGWSSITEKIRVRVQGTEYAGKVCGFDGERLLLLDDLDVPTIIYLKSGIAIIGPKDGD
jgi:hypothetical protein